MGHEIGHFFPPGTFTESQLAAYGTALWNVYPKVHHPSPPARIAVSVFPDELYPAPRSWAERAYPKLIHYNKFNKGGHFAAWEQPQLFSEEVRTGFRSLR